MADLPGDIEAALHGSPASRARFEGLPPSHTAEYLKWIAEARKPETRARRISAMIERLCAGE
jgi:uncharacterized protein YdeI (YjbR/CyaY-like superfamily)